MVRPGVIRHGMEHANYTRSIMSTAQNIITPQEATKVKSLPIREYENDEHLRRVLEARSLTVSTAQIVKSTSAITRRGEVWQVKPR